MAKPRKNKKANKPVIIVATVRIPDQIGCTGSNVPGLESCIIIKVTNGMPNNTLKKTI